MKFYRQQFEAVVTEESINRIKNEFKGSAEERRDLLNAYNDYGGRLEAIYQTVMLSDVLEDDDRFRQILNEEIAKGTIQSCPAYERDNNDEVREKVKNAERKRREDFDKRQQQKEAKEGRSGSKTKGKKSDPGSMADLAAMIQQRQKARSGNFFDHLEARYAPKSRGSKRATPMDEPPEEMFEATAARAKKKRPNSRAKKTKNNDETEPDLAEEDIGESEGDEEEVPKTKRRGKARKGRGRAKAKT